MEIDFWKCVSLTCAYCKQNTKLKELLKECKRQFEEVALYRYDIADDDQEDWFKISTEQAGIANKMIAKIDQALGEDK